MGKGLTRVEIVDEALRLLDETGLDGLNMRALATRLDVKAPALYWHFAHKQALVDEMATELWRRVVAASPRTGTWQEQMVGFARVLRTELLAHRDGAKLFSGTYLTDVSVLESQEEPLAAMVAGGVELEAAIDMSGVLYAYVIGATIEEQAVRQTSVTDDRYSLAHREERLDPERYPLMTAAGRLVLPDPGTRFDRNVRRLVAGFERWGARTPYRERVAITLGVLLWARPGLGADLTAYEDEVLALLAAHNGRLVGRLRSGDGADDPTETQLITFADEAGYNGYLADPRRTMLAGERDRVVERTQLYRGELL